jgi:hypothetical protein
MSRNLYLLLPDGREPSGSVLSAFKELAGAPAVTIGDGIAKVVTELEPDEILATLASVDWHHPLLVAYRQSEESRWSYLTITGQNRVATE